MKTKAGISVLLMIFGLGGYFARGQNIHFSQFNNAPLLLNPALAGSSTSCFLKLGINYKNQWSKTYVTQSAFADARIALGEYKHKDGLGLGGLFFSDKAGDGDLTTNYGMAVMALHKSFNPAKTVFGSLGFSFGLGNLSINYSNLYFDNQWNGFLFDPDISNNESFTSSSLLYYDINSGFLMTFIKPDKYRMRIGGSLTHFLGQQYSFLGQEIKRSRRYLFHSDMEYLVNDKYILSPAFLYSWQDFASEAIAGTNLAVSFSKFNIITGLWIRIFKDIIPLIGIEYNGYSLNFSYDINITNSYVASHYNGGLEFSLIKNFCYSKEMIHTMETVPCTKW